MNQSNKPIQNQGEQSMSQKQDQIIGVISPRSVGGLSLFETEATITSDNVGEFRSEESDINSVCNELMKLGFNIQSVGQTSISFAGAPKLFRNVFGVKLRKEKKEIFDGQQIEFLDASNEDVDKLLDPPQALSPLTEGVAVAHPPELFASALPPIAPINSDAYRYFYAPDDVAVMLQAGRVHRLGVTGNNVTVAMIDTGHYAHPFFSSHGYRVMNTILGPGQSNPGDDMVGHGTGESANIFAAAPDIILRPIKGLSDPVGDFNQAVTSTPTPQIITNSWGYNVDYQSWAALQSGSPSLYTYLRLLEAAVANAISIGITVCFSCGNGTKRGFPSSHPEVISVGGVHVNYPDLTLEASNYASSFPSSMYPGRHCPDVCGLTGKVATINGSTRAPSIMLPVQPGANLDGISPSTGANDDGWGLFSGTSAACPQVAGVIALMLEKDPSLTPAQVKQKLMDSARDITTGSTGTGETAGVGHDDATGAGLVDAIWAYLISMADVVGEFMEASPERQKELVESGQIPRVPKEFIGDIIKTLRSK